MAQDLVIQQGKTFSQVVRWEAPPILYKPITAITRAAPAAITSATHGIPDGWRVAIVSVKGMTQINCTKFDKTNQPLVTHSATVSDANTITLNDVNAADYTAYTSGGYIQMNTPVDMAGYTARMSIKDKIGGTELLRLDTTLVAPQPRIVINNTTKTITLTISATDTAALTWTKGVYDLEMVSSGGVVTSLLSGAITVTKEVTTT